MQDHRVPNDVLPEKLLLASALGFSGILMLLTWSFHVYPLSTQTITIDAVLPLLIVQLVVTLAGVSIWLVVGIQNGIGKQLLGWFQSRRTYLILLLEFAFAQGIIVATGYSYARPSASALLSVLVGLWLIVWLVFHRPALPVAEAVWFVAWGLIVTCGRQALAAFAFTFLRTEPNSSPIHNVALAMFMITLIVLVGLLLFPLILQLPRFRAHFKRLSESYKRQPMRVYRLLLYAAVFLLVAGLLPLPHREAAVWLALLTGAPFVGVVITRLANAEAHADTGTWTLDPRLIRNMRNGLLAAVVILGVIGALGFMWTWFPDMYSYLQMSKDYARGDFVMRGYWAPLMPWLLALPIRLGLDPQVSQRYLNILVGVGLVAATIVLGRRYRLSPLFQLAAASSVGLVFLEYGFFPGTADWLSAVFPTLMFVVILRDDVWTRPLRSSLILGVLVALGYYSKHYNLPFMAVVLIGSGMLAILHGARWRAVAKVVVGSLLVTALLMAPWVAGIYKRYGVLTFSTTSLIARNTPTSGGLALGCIDWFLCDDPPDVLFPWEDQLAHYFPGLSWSPFASIGNFQQQLNSLGSSTFVIFNQFPLGPFGFLAVCCVALGIFLMWHQPRIRFLCAFSLLAILVQVGGYISTGYLTMYYLVEFRYHIMLVPLVAVLLMWVVQSGLAWIASREQSTGTTETFYQKHRWLLGLFIVGLLLQTSNITMYLSRLPSLQTVTSWLTSGVPRPFACDRQAAEAIDDILIPPFATTDLSHIAISFYTEKRTMGTLRWPRSEIPQNALDSYKTIGIEPPNTPAEVDAQLQRMGIRTLIAVDDADLVEALVKDFRYQTVRTLTLCNQSAVILYPPKR